VDNNLVSLSNGVYTLREERRDIAIKYSLLDCIANFGHAVNRQKEKGVLCVPGYSTEWGLNQEALLEAFGKEFPQVSLNAKDILSKIQWLIDNEFVIIK